MAWFFQRGIAGRGRWLAVLGLIFLPLDIGAAEIEVLNANLTLDGAAGELPVTFPDYWYTDRRLLASSGTYRAAVYLDPQGQDVNALFIPGMSGRSEVYWDGELLGRTTPLSGVGVPTISGPLLVAIPSPLTEPGQHELEIRFRGLKSQLGYVRAPLVTSFDVVEGEYALKKLTLVYLPVAFGAISIIVAFVFYAGYRNDSAVRGIGLLTAGLLGVSVSLLGLYFPPPDEWASYFYRARLSLFHLSFVFFLAAILAVRNKTPRWGSYLVFAISAAMVVAISVVPLERIYQFGVIWLWLSYGIGIYLLISVVRIALEPPRRLVSLIPISLVPLFAVHDWVGVINGGEFWADQALSIYNSALFAGAIMTVMVIRARKNSRDIEVLNQTLEKRVADKHLELQQNYSQMAEAERREAIANERQRMVREMHDGLGGQLVSTLAMVESRQFSNSEVEAALRDSLDDLRIMVLSMDHDIESLGELLALVRERIEPRLSRQGISLKWSVHYPDGEDGLDQEQVAHVLRIIQEAFANVLRHAQATEIALEASVSAGRISIALQDNGCGLSGSASSEVFGGSGLNNMSVRAEKLGGSLEVQECGGGDGPGTRVELSFPVRSPTQNHVGRDNVE